jgi:nucleotidyltransferase/DNA polymerase involved in DNA repair
MPIQRLELQKYALKERHLRERHLGDLVSIGPAMLRDFDLLGIRSVKQLARQNPTRLYQKLCRVTGQYMDICCQDVFSAAVAQARNPLLPAEQCQWWYWSRQRKANHAHK